MIDSIEYDNKVYFETKRGIDWAKIDFARYDQTDPPSNWDGGYGAAGRLMQKMRAEGREALQVVIDSCRDMGIEVLAGLRMNDCHALEPLSLESPDVSFHLQKHPEQAFCFPGTDERTRLADFENEDLRAYRFALIEELLEKFDFDGIELNWVRAPYLFAPDTRSGPYGYITEERFDKLAPIMTRWTADIRDLLDDWGRKRGKQMVLGLRVPETPEITRDHPRSPERWASTCLPGSAKRGSTSSFPVATTPRSCRCRSSNSRPCARGRTAPSIRACSPT